MHSFALCLGCASLMPHLEYEVAKQHSPPYQYGACPGWDEEEQFCEGCRDADLHKAFYDDDGEPALFRSDDDEDEDEDDEEEEMED